MEMMSERETGLAPWVAPVRPLPLFAYGTLQNEEFVQQLLEHSVELQPVTLRDFRRLEFPDFDYPFVVPYEGGRVPGQMLLPLKVQDYERLDAYEGVGEELYQRVEATVERASGETVEVYVYTATDKTLDRYGG
ncbi:MAG: gamma-glutamylcyclotransferase family protein [Acidobacteriota bacterium]